MSHGRNSTGRCSSFRIFDLNLKITAKSFHRAEVTLKSEQVAAQI